MPATCPTSTQLAAVATSNAAFQQAALGYFNGIRLPASLIAGSSVAAVFSLLQQARDSTGLSPTEVWILRLYHVSAILSFVLSMTTVTTTTTASTLLLLGKSFSEVPHIDVYHFLRGELNLEFVLTRWAFLSSIITFLTGVTSRILLELHLCRPNRRITGVMVTGFMTSIVTGLLGLMNQSLNCWPNWWYMTMEVAQLLWQRTVLSKSVLLPLSMASLGVAIACVGRLAWH